MDVDESCTPMDESLADMMADCVGAKRSRVDDDASNEAQEQQQDAATEDADSDSEHDHADDQQADYKQQEHEYDELDVDDQHDELPNTFEEDTEQQQHVLDADGDSPMEDAETSFEDIDDGGSDAAQEDTEVAEQQGSDVEGQDEADEQQPLLRLRDPSTIKRAQSSWMFFLADKREEIRAANPGLKVGEVVKLCSAMWSALSPEDRAKYDDAAAADKLRMQKELAEAGLKKLPAGGKSSDKDGDLPPDQTIDIILPLSRVRKTAKLDEDVRNINRDGLAVIAKATELFIAHMAQRTWGVSKQLGRKNMRVADLVEAVYADGALYFLRDEFAAERKSGSRGSAPPAAKKLAIEAPAGTKSITSFFQKTS